MMSNYKKKLTSILSRINDMSRDRWTNFCRNAIYKSPEIVHKTWRPEGYNSIFELEQAFSQTIDRLSRPEKVKLLNRHKDALQNIINEFMKFKTIIDSGVIVKFFDIIEFEMKLKEIIDLLEAYEKHYGFPFILKPTNINFQDFYSALEIRCNNTVEQEMKIAVEEIKKYTHENVRYIIHWKQESSIFE